MKVNHIIKTYGENRVIDDFSYDFEPGIYALLGESGKGKTTLLSILAGIVKPDSGCIDDRREPVYMVFQENRLVEELTAIANIKLINPKLKKEDMIHALNCVGVKNEDKKDIFSIPVSQFSGGMKRRVCLVSVVESSGNLLLLDEPFSGLDPENKKKAMDYIMSKKKDRIIIFSTHDENDADYMNAVKIYKKI